MFKNGKEREYVAVILRNENGQLVKIAEKKIDKDAETFVYNKITFPVKLNVSFYDKNKAMLHYEMSDKPKLLSFNALAIPMSLAWLDLLVTRNILTGLFGRLIKGLEKIDSMGSLGKIFGYVLCIAVGGLGGYLLHDQTASLAIATFLINNWVVH